MTLYILCSFNAKKHVLNGVFTSYEKAQQARIELAELSNSRISGYSSLREHFEDIMQDCYDPRDPESTTFTEEDYQKWVEDNCAGWTIVEVNEKDFNKLF